MDISNRMHDVVKLRCNACQDFLKMILPDNWRELIYKKAESAYLGRDRAPKAKYAAVYEKMRDIGIENYSVADMDVTFIFEVISYRCGIVSVSTETYKAVQQLAEDRNVTNHSGENEEAEELYLRALLSLLDLRSFIRTVDKHEVSIPNEERLAFRRDYIQRIEVLKDILDDERISLIQNEKKMRRDIQKVLESDDLDTWAQISQEYLNRAHRIDKNPEYMSAFIEMASDAGVKYAHKWAASESLIKRDYSECERRLQMMFDAVSPLTAAEAHDIIIAANEFINAGNSLSSGMQKMVDYILAEGFPVEKIENGLYSWKSKSPYVKNVPPVRTGEPPLKK